MGWKVGGVVGGGGVIWIEKLVVGSAFVLTTTTKNVFREKDEEIVRQEFVSHFV